MSEINAHQLGADDDDEDDLGDDRHYEDLRGDAGDDLRESGVPPLAGAHGEEGLGVPDAVALVEQDGEEFASAVLKTKIPK